MQTLRHRVWQCIDTADGLKHDRLLRDVVRVGEIACEARADHGLQIVGRGQRAGLACSGGPIDVTAPRRSLVREVRAQPGSRTQILEQLLLVAGRQCGIQLVRRDRFGEQLAHMAVVVGTRFTNPDLAIRSTAVHVGRIVVVVEHLDRNIELAAIAEGRVVMLRNSRGARVVVVTFVEGTDLRLTRYLRFASAAPDRPDASARTLSGFENATAVTELAELVCSAEPGGAGSEDQHILRLLESGQILR